nr:MAG TPA: hypothetical protein [Caudoviricetes sp.]
MWLFFLYSMLLLVMGTYKMYLLKKDCLYGRSMVVFEGNSGIFGGTSRDHLQMDRTRHAGTPHRQTLEIQTVGSG